MKENLVSIIVPCYNVVNYLKNFIDSIINQTYKDYEVIFVNDGSSDGTLAYLNERMKDFENVKIINQVNHGLAHARNEGLKRAQGEYVAFFDPDDQLHKKTLEENITFFSKYSIDVVMFGMEYVNESFEQIKEITLHSGKDLQINDHNQFRKHFHELFFETSFFSACNKLYRKDFLIENQLVFPEIRTGQDSIFICQMMLKECRFYINHKIYYYYRFGRPGSAAANKVDDRRIIDDNKVCESFKLFTRDLGLSPDYYQQLSFQKINKLFEKVRSAYADPKDKLKFLFSQSEFQTVLKLPNIYSIKGIKNKLKFIYLVKEKNKWND